MTTRSEAAAADVAALLRARNPLLWVVTREEARAESYLIQAAAAAGYVPRMWDCGQGVTTIDGKPDNGAASPDEMLPMIRSRALQAYGGDRGAWIMRDLPPWLVGPIGMQSCRQVRNLARLLPGVPRDRAQALIVLTPSGEVPPELSGHATVIEWPLPDREEIAALLDAAIEALPEEIKASAAPNGVRDAAIDAAVGLTGEEAQACFAKSLVQTRKVEPSAIAREKKRVIARERVLEWFDPLPGGLDAVGGLENLKTWLVQRELAFSPKARAYGLPAPKGAFLVGVSGCGKSLTAKAAATAFRCPLIKYDMGAMKDKFVGGSEANVRKAQATIAAIGRCVVWIDEIEKGLAGAVQGGADGGVSADALGSLLTWMQEKQGEAFVIATANDISQLPPELLRKGRFDQIFFVDLPNRVERLQILYAALRTHGRDFSSLQAEKLADVVTATNGFTGSEIAALVPDAMFAAFADGGREINIYDLLTAAFSVTPLSKTAAEKIDALRAWAKGRACPATAIEATVEPTARARQLDI